MIVVGMDPSITSFGISDGLRTEKYCTVPGRETYERAAEIIQNVAAFLPSEPCTIVIEGSIFGQAGAAFDAGYLRALIENLAHARGDTVYVVQPATVNKFVRGTSKLPRAVVVYKRWGAEFENDKGEDMLDAFCLHKYGEAIQSGEIDHTAPRQRGRKTKTAPKTRKTKEKAA